MFQMIQEGRSHASREQLSKNKDQISGTPVDPIHIHLFTKPVDCVRMHIFDVKIRLQRR